MAFNWIEQDDLLERFNSAKKFMLPLHQPMNEWERIARNQPYSKIAKGLPRVTDGTLAALIQETPKRVIQQIPSGQIITDDRWLEIVAGYILKHEIIPNSQLIGSLIQKSWALVSKALTYGSQPAYVQFINRGDYFGTDFTLPYIKDVLLEPGKLSDRDSNVIFLRTWWTKNQIKAILAKEQLLVKNSEDRGDAETYQTGWNLKLLQDLITDHQPSQKDMLSATPTERQKSTRGEFYEIVHCFQRGIEAKFYSFSPALDKDNNLLREWTNPDPRGQVPIHFMYANLDFSNPLGRGAVELAGGMQNLLDSEVQMYQYNRALMLNPPMLKRGTWSKSQAKFEPNALIDLGVDPTAMYEPITIESGALTNFPSNYQLIKSQIINLNNSPDTNISATAGSPANSKTPQGVAATQARLGISDNYLRKQFENTMEEILETEVNLYFAQRSGTQDITLDPETADKLRDIAPQAVSEDNQIRIDYDTETPKMSFKVDPASSAIDDDQEQITALQELLQATTQNPYIPYLLQSENKELKIGEAYAQLFERFKIRNLDKIIVDIPIDPQTGQPVPGHEPRVMTPFFDKPSVSATFKDLPPAAQVQLLANGGITIQESDVLQPNIEQMAGGRYQNPVKPAYVDPQTGHIVSGWPPIGTQAINPETGEPAQLDYTQHPVIQLMTSLQIKFTDLPPDSQAQLLQAMGTPSTSPTPSTTKTQIEASNAAVNVAKLQHDQQTATNAHRVAASDSAVKVAQLHHQAMQPIVKPGTTNGQ